MPKEYTIQELSTICKVSKTSIYNRFKKNQSFIKDNSRREKAQGQKSKSIIKYNQSVLDWLMSYYDPTILENTTARGTSTPFFKDETARGTSTQEVSAETKIEALQAELKELKAELETVKAERSNLISQNGNLLLLLNQEKAEKQLLLPTPKKTIRDHIKTIFGKKKE